MRFTEIPRRLQPLLAPPDPIVIHHLIKLGFILFNVGYIDSFSVSLVFAVTVLMLQRARGPLAMI